MTGAAGATDGGGIDIRGGGVVAVDTTTLREVAARFADLADELRQIGVLVGSAGGQLFALGNEGWDLANEVEQLRRRVQQADDAASDFDIELRSAAATYETIELRAERAVAAAAGDVDGVVALDARAALIAGEFPGAAEAASAQLNGRGMLWPRGLAEQASAAQPWWLPGVGPVAGLATAGFWQGVRAAGEGTVPSGALLRPTGATAAVTVLHRSRTEAAPTSLAGAAARIPGGAGQERVRVEKYTMPDGSRQFAVYVAGTRSVDARGGRDAFDMTSNLQLYGGARSSSYEATVEALRLSGARPGDTVHEFGHSQGAMIAAHVALEGGYDTKTLVSFGSPVEADVGAGTLSVSLRHTDDPVAGLEGGGHAEAVGAPGSFVAERLADPATGWRDVKLAAHGIDGYTATAEMLDVSPDPRMAPVRALFAELGTATSVETVQYAAERPQAVPHPQPGGLP
ncbi:hypothetical protein ACFM35_12795 [Microbacterium sp. P01]|uniref:hypothetical protein n=1 Tax=Microbacterium sp. P01 TaxID=3366261 RepID=UPI00366FE2ED